MARIDDGSVEPTVLELERLAPLFGLEAETLGESPITIEDGDAVTPAAELEKVLDRFGFDPPAEAA